MDTRELNYIVDELDSRVNRLLDTINNRHSLENFDFQNLTRLLYMLNGTISELSNTIKTRYSLEKYSSSTEIMDYFGIDKPTFNKFLKQGLPVTKIGSRWKGKLGEIEQWFKNQTTN